MESLKKLLHLCESRYLEEYASQIDEIDINIVNNYTDYLIMELEIMTEKVKERQNVELS